MASYNPPNPYVPNAFNPTQFITPSDNITTKYLDENYLRFPFAQGTENFVSINNQGSLNQGGLADFTSNTTPAIFNLPPTITNPILDTATTPLNAVATIGYVLANEQGGGDLLPLNNNWSGVNNFNPTPIQPYGATLNQGITLTNNQNNSTPTGENNIISYTPSSTQGLCIFSSSTNSVIGKTAQIELQPDGVRTSLFANGTNGVIQLNALGGTQSKIVLQSSSGVLLQLTPVINFNNWGTLSTTSGTSGLVSNVNVTSTGVGINDGVNNSYLLYTNTSPSNFGLVIANTTGGNGTLTLSNNSTTLTTLASTTTGLNISTAVNLPPQTYAPSITYGDIASTQQFVQQALASQGSGDAVLAGNNAFTGDNTFSGFCGTASIQGYPLASTNQFASIDYVNNLVPTNNNIGLTPSSGQIIVGGNIPVLRTSSTINFGNNSNTTVDFATSVSSWTFIMQNVNGSPVSGQTSVFWTLFNPRNYTYQPLNAVQTGYSTVTFQFNSNVDAGSYVLYLNGYLLLID